MTAPVTLPTRRLPVDPERPAANTIAEAAQVLALGGLVAFPTETVYGLGAHALNVAAIEGLFAAKGRPSTDPVIVHLASVDALETVARDVPDVARLLASRFWPGPLTMILRKQAQVPDTVSAGLPTVGVRVPSHPVAQALLRACALPIAAPSANRFSQPSPTTADHVLADLEGRIDLVLDAGATQVGVESTVLDLTVSPPLVRRPGGVTLEELRAVIADVTTSAAMVTENEAQRAPGQLQRHYAPRARLTLYVGDTFSVAQRLGADARQMVASGRRVGILGPEEDLMAIAPAIASAAVTGRIRLQPYGARSQLDRAARELFAALRALDAEGVDEILATAPDAQGIGVAIVDRLTRAAEGRVKRV